MEKVLKAANMALLVLTLAAAAVVAIEISSHIQEWVNDLVSIRLI